MHANSRFRVVGALAIATALAACSSPEASGPTVAVAASDDECQVVQTEFDSGPITFAVTNNGSQVTEVYVYGENDRVMGEVENIGPGTSRNLQVTLGGGDYEVACKPGQTGNGIRVAIDVSGEANSMPPPASQQIEVTAADYDFEGVDDVTIAAGETIEFEMINSGTVDHEFEVLGPEGGPLGEVGPTEPGEDGHVTLTFSEAGTYTFVCGIDDHEERGMVGTFEVS